MKDTGEINESTIAECLTMARATPQRIATSTAGVDISRLTLPPAPGEWSVVEIFNHLRACEEVWMHSVHAMLTFDNPSLTEIHPRQWIKTANPYTSQAFARSLEAFTLRRQALLLTLEALAPADWARGCRIERKAHTVFSHVRRMVQHENTHCDEIDVLLK